MDDEDFSLPGCIRFDAYKANRASGMINVKLRALHNYWDDLRAGRIAPMRADVDPRGMPCDVRSVFIVEALNGANIRFRVAGSALTQAFGMELRGMNVRAIMAAGSRESFSALISETLEDPGVGYARLAAAHDPEQKWEILMLPLRSDYGAIDRMMGALIPLGDASRGHGPLHFQIDQMHVDSIVPSVLDGDSRFGVSGFAEPLHRFDHNDLPPRLPTRPRLHSIEGGREGEEDPSQRSAAHLRVVDD